MHFHGVNMQGKFHNEILDVLPIWSTTDERRLVYIATDDSLYLGTSTGWCKLICGTGVLGNTADVLIRKFVCGVDATIAGAHLVWTVGEDAIFFVDTMELITTNIVLPGTMPYVKWGVQLDDDDFVVEEQLNADMAIQYRRQIWSKPFSGALQDTELIVTVTQPGSSSIHDMCAVITGYLLPNTDPGPNIPYPAHNIVYTAEDFSW